VIPHEKVIARRQGMKDKIKEYVDVEIMRR
jgi:hypothetical protein